MEQLQAYAKINWGLKITGKRADGYHIIDTLMQRIELHDTISIQKSASNQFSIRTTPELFSQDDNLLYKAICCYLGKEDMTSFFPYDITLEKHIPMCAGLGGASADAGSMLLYLNKHFLKINSDELHTLATSLGADVPFCMTEGLARCKGIGEQITTLSGKECILLLVQPNFGISTAALFQSIQSIENLPTVSIDQIQMAVLHSDFSLLQSEVTNHLQWLAEKQYPIIRNIIDKLYHEEASFAAMSGAGSCCFGVFETTEQAKQAKSKFDDTYFTSITHTLLGHYNEE